MKKNYIQIIFFIIAFCESIYLYIKPSPREGLNSLFILPLIFSFCILIFGKKLIHYQKDGVGLKIYYVITIIRFIIQPFLIVLSDGELNFRMPEPFADSYPIAILIYCLEIIISSFVIIKYYPKFILTYGKNILLRKQTSLNIYGFLALIFFSIVLLIRYAKWLPELNILGIKAGDMDIDILLDATFFNCIKVFVFISLLVEARRNYNKGEAFNIFIFLAIIAGIFNIISFFGTNRSFIYESTIATIALIIYSFPKLRNKILIFSLPFAIFVMFSTYVSKQFSSENTILIVEEDNLTITSNIIEEYANGVWTVASSYQASIGISPKDRLKAFIKDISDGFGGLADIPGIKSIIRSLETFRSSSDIFKDSLRQEGDRGQMLSFSGGLLIVGGEIIGWFFLVIGNYLMIMFLLKMEVLSKLSKDLYYKYMYLWMACLIGLIHAYCLQTIIFSWSKFILFYWIVLFINEKGASKKRLVKINNWNFKTEYVDLK